MSISDITERRQASRLLQGVLEEVKQRRQEVFGLLKGSRAVLNHCEFKSASKEIFNACKALIGATCGYVAILNEEGTDSKVVFLDPGIHLCTADRSLPMPIRGLREQAYQTGKALWHNDYFTSHFMDFLPDGHVKLNNVLFAPLKLGNKTVGILGLANKPGGFNERNAQIATAFGEFAAIALRSNIVQGSLQSSEERFRSVVETATDAIMCADNNGDIVFWNDAAEAILGYRADEIIGKPLQIVIPEEFHEAHQKGLINAVSGGGRKFTGHTVETVGLKKDGSKFPVELSVAKWEAQGETFFTSILRDITDRKRAEEELRRSHDELEERVRERTEELSISNALLKEEVIKREHAQRLNEALNDINAAINSTLDFDVIIKNVVVEAAKAIGCETAGIALLEDGFWVVKHACGLPEEAVGFKISADRVKLADLISATGTPIAIGDINLNHGIDREFVDICGLRAFIIVPLMLKGEVIGALIFNYHSAPVFFTDAQIDFAGKLTTSVSLAIENARLYQAKRCVADTLQEAFLTTPKNIDGIDFGYLYRSATKVTKLGGDFYDLFELNGDKICIAIGDVSGKGIEAATLASSVKNSIKAYAFEGYAPDLIVAKVSDIVRQTSSLEMFVTLFLGIINVKDGSIIYCNAGHPWPVLKRKGCGAMVLSDSFPLIGAFPDLSYANNKEILERGDVLLLYTDGIIEARCEREFFSEARLLDFINKPEAESVQNLPQVLFDEIMGFTNGELFDDVAVLSLSLSDGNHLSILESADNRTEKPL